MADSRQDITHHESIERQLYYAKLIKKKNKKKVKKSIDKCLSVWYHLIKVREELTEYEKRGKENDDEC